MDDLSRVAVKVGVHLAKFENGRKPEDGEPDEVIEAEVWQDFLTGELITDPERIAYLESRVAAQGG